MRETDKEAKEGKQTGRRLSSYLANLTLPYPPGLCPVQTNLIATTQDINTSNLLSFFQSKLDFWKEIFFEPILSIHISANKIVNK